MSVDQARSRTAIVLLVLMALSMLRLSLHRCERTTGAACGKEKHAAAPHGNGRQVQADRHCALCEAPAPVHGAAAQWCVHPVVVSIGVMPVGHLQRMEAAPADLPAPRGPPSVA